MGECKMQRADIIRLWLIRWLYLIAVGHLVMAIAMTWCADSSGFARYHQNILLAFGFPQEAPGAMAMQLWWIALFGATLQAFALFLLALVYLVGYYRHARIWLLLAGIVLLWAPQDIFISIRQNVWVHVWVDLAAVVALVPPLLALWWLDRNPVGE
jgi:hypothetical protein